MRKTISITFKGQRRCVYLLKNINVSDRKAIMMLKNILMPFVSFGEGGGGYKLYVYTPLMLSTTTRAPSVTLSAAVTSEEKST